MIHWMIEKIFHLLIHGRWSMPKASFSEKEIETILVVRTDNLGDVLCCTPAIRALRQAYPKAYLAALVVRYSQEALLGNPDLDEVFVYEKAKHRPDRSRIVSLYEKFRVMKVLREKKFDLAIGLRSSFSWSEAWLVYFSGAKFRLGYPPTEKKDQPFSFFYNLSAKPLSGDRHEVEKVLHLVAAVGASTEETHLFAVIPEEERKTAEDFIVRNRIDPEKLIGLHLSSRVPANRWSLKNYIALADRLIREGGLVVILTCGPGDESFVPELQRRFPLGLFYYPTPNFKSLGALQERCRVFVSPDGGPMHLATAVGTPTVGLFGKTNPAMWGPWGEGNVALRKGPNADMISAEEVFRVIMEKIREGQDLPEGEK
jgi:heptosyltransferase-3